MSNRPVYCYVGCYTTQFRKARGKGIRVFSIDRASGEWELIQEIPVDPIVNPSFLTFSRDKTFIYSSHGEHTEASAYKICPESGKLTLVNRAPSGGYNGAHIAISKTRPYLFVSNYNSGIVAAIKIKTDGSLGEITDLYLPQGANGDLMRQQFSHPHQVMEDPDGKFLIICDLGKDKVYTADFDKETGKFKHVSVMETTPAMCPRHMCFHPSAKYGYILAEHLGGLLACNYDPKTGRLAPFQLLSSVPDSAVGYVNDGAEIAIHPTGEFIYISNRGHNSICTFRIEQETGRASIVGWYPTTGLSPRYFAVDEGGNFLIVCNELSDTIVVFRIDKKTGALSDPIRRIETPSPSCILFSGALPNA